MVERNELKYQYIKLMKGGYSLRDIRAMMRSVTAGIDDEYVDKKEKQSLSHLVGGLQYLTRRNAIDVMKLKFSEPRSLPSSREEYVSNYVSGYNGSLPHNWKRYGSLIRKGRPNPPRPGTSKRHIGRSKIIGASKVLRDARQLTATLQNMVRKYGNKKKAGQLAKQMNIVTSVIPK